MNEDKNKILEEDKENDSNEKEIDDTDKENSDSNVIPEAIIEDIEKDIMEDKESSKLSEVDMPNLREDSRERKVYESSKKDNNSNSLPLVKLFIVIIFSFIIGGISMIALIKYTPVFEGVLDTSEGTVITKNKTQVYEKSSLAPAIEKAYEAVVLVQCYQDESLASSGTGFVYKVDNKYGYILTNAHVIDKMQKVTVTFSDDEEADVKVLGSDAYLDLAVLRVDKKYVSLVTNIGDSENISLGDTVFAIGSPLGYDYRGSVTSGILSGKDRMVTVSVSSSTEDWVMRVLQLDASINPGNSGGPLLNVNGEVIGICSMKLVDSDIEGMGFAIPIEYAMSHVDQLEKGEDIEWPVLGISMANINDTANLYRSNIRVDDNITEGVVVIEAVAGSAAKKGGLQKGDVITKLGDNSVKNIAYLRYELYQHSAGDEVTITYIRNGKTQTTKIRLGKSS